MTPPRFPAGAVPGLQGDLLNERSSSPKDDSILGGVSGGLGSVVTQGVALVNDHSGVSHNLASSTKVIAASGAGKSYHYTPVIKVVEDWVLEHQEQKAENTVQLFSDATLPSMGKPLSENPVAGWCTAEAGFALQSMKPANYPLLVNYHDGGIIQRHRVGKDSQAFRPFFTVLHLLQDTIFDEISRRHGKISHGCGNDARTRLVVIPKEWVGSEDVTHNVNDGPCQQKVNARVKELLDITQFNMSNGMKDLPVEEFSSEAKKTLFVNQKYCQKLLEDPKYANCDDFLQKHSVHVIKLAASWHVFEGRSGNISCEYVERAIEVIDYHLDCWRYTRSQHRRERREVVDAKNLYEYVMHNVGRRPIPYNELRHLAANIGLASTTHRDNALAVLYESGHAVVDGKGVIKFLVDTSWTERVLNSQSSRFPL